MITRGTTLECFLDLMERIEPQLYVNRRLLANVLGVEDSTVRRWVIGPGTPIGMSMISLRYYLDFLGYQVSEINRLPPHINGVGRLLAFRVLSLEEMTKLTGDESFPDHLFAVLRGVRGISAERGDVFRDIVESYREELRKKQLTTPRLVIVNPESAAIVPVVVSAQKVGSTDLVQLGVIHQSKSKSRSKSSVVLGQDEQFKELAIGLLELARLYTDSAVSEKVRDQLRQVVGQQNIFDLKNLLSRLCSSKAFSNQQ